MRLAYAFWADAAQTTPDGKLWVLGGDIEDIVAIELPVTVAAMALVIKFLLTEAESEQPHDLRLKFAQPNGAQQIPPFDFPFRARRRAEGPGTNPGVSLVINFQQLIFFAHGKHTLRISVDDKSIGGVPLYIRPV